LCLTDPPSAARFLAQYFSRQKSFSIALLHPDGSALDGPGMVDAVSEHLKERATFGHHGRDAEAAEQQRRMVASIRSGGALPSLAHRMAIRPPYTTQSGGPKYSGPELDEALGTLKEGKACIKGSYAAVRADSPGGYQLSLALVNLGRACRLTSILWSLRRFAPLRKCGPRLVRSAVCLRPISLCSDMAAVQDALWLARCRGVLERFAGPEQVGGRSDAQSLLLAMIIHAQLREHQGLPTFWVFTDLKWAFDLMTHDCLLLACFQAGVVAEEWLLLDDMLFQDCQSVQLMGYLSGVFSLRRGTGQGRKWSGHIVNANMRWLRDDMLACSTPARAWLPPYAAEVLRDAELLTPACPEADAHDRAACVVTALSLRRRECEEGSPWRATRATAVRLLAALPAEAARWEVLELMGRGPLGPVQLADDTTAVCSCAEAAASIIRDGCSRFARRAHATFNYGPNKTAVMQIGVAKTASEADVGGPLVRRYRNLGVLFDDELTFSPRMRELRCQGAALCNELVQTANSAGFPLSVQAREVTTRVGSAILYAAEVLIELPKAEEQFNQIQQSWARQVLGCGTRGRIKGTLAVAQCGWTIRLGTLFLEQVLMARARAAVLPADHPLARVIELADQIPAHTWARASRLLQRSQRWLEPIPDLTQSPSFTPDELQDARGDAAKRREVLRRYKWTVVRPALVDYDSRAYTAAASSVIPTLAVPFARFLPCTHSEALEGFPPPRAPMHGKWLQAWALTRIAGKWPAVLWNGVSLLTTLDACPACDLCDVQVSHVCECPSTHSLRQQLASPPASLSGLDGTALLLQVLDAQGSPERRWALVVFLGNALSTILGRHGAAQGR
jgi:hypothetical protein